MHGTISTATLKIRLNAQSMIMKSMVYLLK